MSATSLLKKKNAAGKALIIRDNIHGDFTIEREYRFIVDHDRFQRLRHIGQTGFLYLVYPGMRHSRFEHSIGAFHLAKGWYNSIIEKFDPKKVDQKNKFLNVKSDVVTCEGDRILLKNTFSIYTEISRKPSLRSRWERVVATAALMHDIGHGPLSHSIENLKILSLSDYRKYCSSSMITEFVKKKLKSKSKIKHEDFSLIYIDEVLSELSEADSFFQEQDSLNILCVAALVHKDFRAFFLESADISEADKNVIRLFSNIISGLFDVDRMDYLERDSKSAGIKYGLVESQRLSKALVPVLAQKNDKIFSGLICKARLVHALDHFLVCLYEMYTQLYKHPAYEGFQFEAGELIKAVLDPKSYKMNIACHSMQTDFSFFSLIDRCSNGLLTQLLNRQLTEMREVFQTYEKGSREIDQKEKFKLIGEDKREIVKDSVKVWLINDSFKKSQILPWGISSLVSSKLKSETYEPQIWWKNDGLERALLGLRKTITADKNYPNLIANLLMGGNDELQKTKKSSVRKPPANVGKELKERDAALRAIKPLVKSRVPKAGNG